jgi:hypothetical protein
MKRALTLGILIVAALTLSATTTSAAMWELDEATALKLTHTSISSGDTGALTLVTTDPIAYNSGEMMGQVGFTGWLDSEDNAADYLATIQIYENSNAGLSGTYSDGIKGFFANDNNSKWSVQMYYYIGTTPYTSGNFVELSPGNSTYLTISDAVILNNITEIGFRIMGNMTNLNGNPSNQDFFHMSVVPVPGALLLGMLGLGITGLKLRKYA